MPDDLSGLKDEFEVEMVAQAAEQADEKLAFLIQALAVELTAPTDDEGRRERSIRYRAPVLVGAHAKQARPA